MNKEFCRLSLKEMDRVSGGDDFGMSAALQLASAQLEMQKSQSQAVEQVNSAIRQVGRPQVTRPSLSSRH